MVFSMDAQVRASRAWNAHAWLARTCASMPNTMTFRQTDLLLTRLDALSTGPTRQHLPDGLRGIEKESLRVTRDGMIALTPHPRVLGSALTHPSLTTDYSEALPHVINGATPNGEVPAGGQLDAPNLLGTLSQLAGLFGGNKQG